MRATARDCSLAGSRGTGRPARRSRPAPRQTHLNADTRMKPSPDHIDLSFPCLNGATLAMIMNAGSCRFDPETGPLSKLLITAFRTLPLDLGPAPPAAFVSTRRNNQPVSPPSSASPTSTPIRLYDAAPRPLSEPGLVFPSPSCRTPATTSWFAAYRRPPCVLASRPRRFPAPGCA